MFKNLHTLRLVAIPLILASFSSFAQQGKTDQNWYLGNSNRAIQFSQPGDTARLINRPILVPGAGSYGNGGGAVASDPLTGGLLFYTDGATVYDATHRPMPNGSGLGGNPSGNQPAVIVQKPGQTSQYYIITNSANGATPGAINFSEVDSALFGNSVFPGPPLGDIGANKAVAVANLTTESEGMIAIPHENGTDAWLITHRSGTDQFTVTTITSAGITAPATTTGAGALINFNASHIAYHPASGRLAVTPSDPNQSIMLYSFDDNSGTLQFDSFVFNSAVTSPVTQAAFYDAEFSNDGNFLYVSRQGEGSIVADVIQYNLSNPSVSPASVLPQPIAKSYGLQIAPDSSIYHIYQATAGGPFLVGKITDPDTTAVEVNYDRSPFGNINFNARQFPSFAVMATPSLSLDFEYAGSCANAPTTFFPTVIPGADSLLWILDDGNTARSWSPTHAYEEGRTYNVTLRAYLNGDSTDHVETVDITPFDLQLTLVQDTTACSCELNFPDAPAPVATNYSDGQPCRKFTLTAEASGQTGAIQWFGPEGLMSDQTTLTLSRVDSAGFYYVKAQDPNSGCFAYAGVNIKEYGVDDPRSNIWYFGNNAGLNFNQDFRETTGTDAIVGDLNAPEGSAVICDANGQIILSTNGEDVFDREGNPLIANPPGFGGSRNATQSALIVPVAGDPTLYYIFTTQEIYPTAPAQYELRYALFDLKLGTNGGIVNGSSSVLFTKSTERITGNQNWLIAHEYGNNNFRAYPITAQGIGSPVISSIGSDHSIAIKEHGEGYMELGGNNMLAVALSTPGVSNVVEIFDFDNATGAVTNFRTVDLQQATGQVYGLEFSGSKLFATTKFDAGGTGSALHEFAYDSATSSYTTKVATIPSAGGELGAIQAAPDGQTYVAINGSGTLGSITINPTVTGTSTFNPAATPPLASGTTSGLGLPNFIQNIGQQLQSPAIDVAGNCFGSPITFTGTGTDPIDTLTWIFGDNTFQKGVGLTEVEHTYEAPGTYTVRLVISNRCVGEVGRLQQVITINPIPQPLNSGVTLCNTPVTLEAVAANDPDLANLSFQWSPSPTDTLRTFSPPPGDGIYTVEVTSAAGCTATGTHRVVDNRPQNVDLGPDQTICQNSAPITMDAGNPGATYEWRLNGAVVSNAQTFTISTATPSPPTYQYILTVTDPFTNPTNPCFIRDTVTFTINPAATFNATPVHAAAPPCGQSNGRIDMQITSTGLYTYVVTGPIGGLPSGSNQSGPSAVIPIPNLRAGTYNIQVTDQVTGCQDQRAVGINDGTFTADLSKAVACGDPIPIIVTTNMGTPYNYRILNGGSATEVVPTTSSTTSPSPPSVPVPNGNYVVEVVGTGANNGCIAVSEVRDIRQETPVEITGTIIDGCTSDIATDPVRIEITTSPSATVSWTGSAGSNIDPTTATSLTMIARPLPGEYEYTVTAEGDDVSSCDNQETFTVEVGTDPAASFEQSYECADDVILSASPSGNYVYRWFRNDTQIVGGQQLFLTLADDGGIYRVDARNTQTGCIVSSPADTVAVLGELTLELSNPQACAGQDFTIEATTSHPPDVYNWTFKGIAIAGSPTDSYTVTSAAKDDEGIYRLVVQRTSGRYSCTAEDQVEVIVAPVTSGLLTDTGIICPFPGNPDVNTREVVLDPGEFVSYLWGTGDTTATYTATQEGTYTVELINIYGCASTDQITLREECDPRIVGPNAFRPSGINKDFFLFSFFIADTDFEIFIFNRWGEMIYHSNDRDFRWNGGYNNDLSRPAPPGTYTYVVRFKSFDEDRDDIKEQRGGVVLLR